MDDHPQSNRAAGETVAGRCAGDANAGVLITRATMAVAVRHSEDVIHQLTRKLREAEFFRDDLARKLGNKQDAVDALRKELDEATRHHRQLTHIT